jgi:SAM-dependent methyltransferase
MNTPSSADLHDRVAGIDWLKAHVPWRAKIGAKVVLSRLPFDYRLWQRMRLFRHGAMDDLAYAEDVFNRHRAIARESGPLEGKTLLELGPGDSVLSALLAEKDRVAHTYLVDSGPYASRDVRLYRGARRSWGLAADHDPPEIWASLEDVLSACDATYLTEGLNSLRALPDASVDFLWSQAVLEHIRRADFAELVVQLRRVLRRSGRMSHEVDFKDHLGGRLNNLRFPRALWEGKVFSSSGFYTNRMRYGDVVRVFAEGGFRVETRALSMWDSLPTPRRHLSAEFQSCADDDLLTSEAHLVMIPID